jgi:poly-gamma-glutamate synthesis protein (capsule biosynthesis protein)
MATWRYDQRRRSYGRITAKLLVLLILLAAGGYFGWKVFSSNNANKTDQKTTQPQTAQKSVPASTVSGRYLFSGTTYWARAIETEAHGDYNQPFSQLNTFHPERYDGWQIDLECPVTNNVVPYADQVNLLVFNCRPEFLPYATKYFNLINLANNHTDNQGGITGLQDTRDRLAKQPGVQYFGTFDPGVTKDDCEVLGLPVRLQSKGKPDTKAKLPIAFCAWHYVFRLPRPGEIEAEQKFAKIMPVFGFAHMGREYIPKAEDTQVSIAHQIIDSGAEFVIANQSHWVQNTEVYKNKLIVYSTGNLIFDQLDTETNRGDNIDVTINVKEDDNVKKWLALGPSCFVYQDSCLAKAEQEGLKKVQLNIQYGVVASLGGYKVITHRADAATQAAVEERMNWSATCQQLTTPYACRPDDAL